jgi:hypothetical protein
MAPALSKAWDSIRRLLSGFTGPERASGFRKVEPISKPPCSLRILR